MACPPRCRNNPVGHGKRRGGSPGHDKAADGEAGAGADDEEFVASLEGAVLNGLVEGGGNGGGDAVAEFVEGLHNLVFWPSVATEHVETDFAGLVGNDNVDVEQAF